MNKEEAKLSHARLLHFALTSEELIYPYYLSIVSALKTQQVDDIMLWCYKEPSGKYYPLLKERITLHIVEKPEHLGLQGKDSHFQYAHLKDLLQWQSLYEYGGMFFDLDTFSLSDASYLLDGSCEMVVALEANEIDSFVESLHIGIVMAEKESQIIKAIWTNALVSVSKKDMEWNGTGGRFSVVCKAHRAKIKVTEWGVLGGWGDKVVNLYSEDGHIWDDALILHLYGKGMSREFKDITEDYIETCNSVFAGRVREVLTAEEWNPTNADDQEVYSQPSLSLVKSSKRFHLIGLPHLPTNKIEGLACAYTQKVRKMGQMLKALGYTVIFYGVEGSDVQCDEFVQVSTKAILKQAYGDYDYREGTFRHDTGDIAYRTFNSNAIKEIRKRMVETDFLLLAWGGNYSIYRELATRDKDDSSKLYLAVESGIGYDWTFAKFRVFESSAWYHHVLGLDARVTPIMEAIPLSSDSFGFQLKINKEKSLDGNNYDVIIPNFFDPADFEYCDKKGDYFLYLGRLIRRKGIGIAIEATKMIGAKLVIAGQPGEKINLDYPHVDNVGYADHAKRKELLKNAKALFVPTLYVEPFGGVSIEAALSGTPVISCDWGAFHENVLQGKTGFRCHTMDHYTWAARNIEQINPLDCYNWAINNFSLARVSKMYQEYFEMIMDIKVGKGWYELHPERTQLDWLRRYMP